jgi:hypothetical protein
LVPEELREKLDEMEKLANQDPRECWAPGATEAILGGQECPGLRDPPGNQVGTKYFNNII